MNVKLRHTRSSYRSGNRLKTMYKQAGRGERGREEKIFSKKKKTKMALENNINKQISAYAMTGDIQFLGCLWFLNVIKLFIDVIVL
jgi:hypothetical protein